MEERERERATRIEFSPWPYNSQQFEPCFSVTQVLEKVVARNIEESELIAGGVSPQRVSKYFNIMQHMSTRVYTRLWNAATSSTLRKLVRVGKEVGGGGRGRGARGGRK